MTLVNTSAWVVAPPHYRFCSKSVVIPTRNFSSWRSPRQSGNGAKFVVIPQSCTSSPPPTPSPVANGSNTPFYFSLFLTQALPLVSTTPPLDIVYFTLTAVSALLLGTSLPPAALPPPAFTSTQAILAPLYASFILFSSYLLITYTSFDVSLLYRIMTTILATISLRELLVPPLRSLFPTSSVAEILSTLCSAGLSLLYLFHFHPTYFFSNVLAASTAPLIISLIRPSSFKTTSLLLIGLLSYDVFWVFFSNVMVSVATTIEAPAKLVFPHARSASTYPFAILGLGDICIPGVFVGLASALDSHLGNETQTYLKTAVASYVVGLLSCFGINATTGAAQPALLYLVPALIGGVLTQAAIRGEVKQVLAFERKEGKQETQQQ